MAKGKPDLESSNLSQKKRQDSKKEQKDQKSSV